MEILKNNHPYIIVTKEEGIVFKIVNKISGKPNLIQLSSTNPMYESYVVEINDLIEVWKFVNYISSELPDVEIAENDLVKSVKGIQRQVNELKSIIEKDY